MDYTIVKTGIELEGGVSTCTLSLSSVFEIVIETVLAWMDDYGEQQPSPYSFVVPSMLLDARCGDRAPPISSYKLHALARL